MQQICRKVRASEWADRVKVLGFQVDVMQNLDITVRGIWCTAGNHYAGFWEKHGATVEGMTRPLMSRKSSLSLDELVWQFLVKLKHDE